MGKCPVPAFTITSLKSKTSSTLATEQNPLTRASDPIRLCLLDGFLLYPPSMKPIHPFLDIRLFLRTTYAKAKARREARHGYVTLEGFWTDPPGYVDKIVWPNYVEEHAYLFEGGDVEGPYREDVLEAEGIKVPKDPEVDGDIEKTLEWAVNTILEELQLLAL